MIPTNNLEVKEGATGSKPAELDSRSCQAPAHTVVTFSRKVRGPQGNGTALSGDMMESSCPVPLQFPDV